MLRIKDDRMKDLEKFGFKREDSAYRYQNTLLIPDWESEALPCDRKVTLQLQAYKVNYIEEMFMIIYKLIKADMVEEVEE